MISFIFKRFSGSHYRKFLKECRPIVARINTIEQQYQSLSNEQLQAKTTEFKARLAKGETLDALLPEAFAAVKSAARRLCGQRITYAGMEDTWNMVHYDVQMIGGIALHQHMIAEMQTGEGKTLVATLPLYLNALSGKNCQLVTVNEFLAQRDSEWMGHLYQFLGLTVGCIKGSHAQTPAEKHEMYRRDITYGTASEFGFDYLRDNGMATNVRDQVQRDHFFCIVDEVDSILVDEARTPLIISGPSQDADDGESFRTLKGPIERLVYEQASLCNLLISQVKKVAESAEGNDKLLYEVGAGETFSALEKMLLVKYGNPKNKVFMRLLEIGNLHKQFDRFEMEMGSDFNKEKRYHLKEHLYYTIEEKQHTADLTEKGRNFLRPDDEDSFMLPDLPTTYMEVDKDNSLDPQQKEKLKLEAQAKFDQVSSEIHTISQLLRAYSLYERDVEYVVQDGKVMIVDENTGRVMPGRRWSDGLHQAVESKENVAIEKETKTYATITLQNYFRLYKKLAGMTGTAETEANEFMDIYKLKVMVIPTNRPCVRADANDLIYKTRRDKFNAAVEEIARVHATGQPCLVGTVSVESSEVLSRMLKRKNIPHTVLNAKFHAKESEIVARAGQRGSVTIATNMAGRGTDIKLGAGIPDLGGLYVIGTERHTSRRIDRQLRGRCARQGDPGMTRFFLSLEDDLMRLYSNQGWAGKILENSFEPGEPLEHRWLNTAIERAQKAVEQQHYSVRKRLLQYDDVLNQQREVVYNLRNDAIRKENPRDTVFELIEEEIQTRMDAAGLLDKRGIHSENLAPFVSWLNMAFPLGIKVEDLEHQSAETIEAIVMDRIQNAYSMKASVEQEEALRGLERYVIINTIDRHWQNHLTEMEELRQSVSLRGYGQKDPLQEYKSEAYVFFEEMMNRVRTDVCMGVFRSATNLKSFQGMLQLLQRARETGPADPDGAVAQPASASTEAAQAELPARKEIQLPKIKAAPVEKALPDVGRNDTVTIRRGTVIKEMKFKKAIPLIENEGWELVRK
jgi:preprotein translocase subunit SecA